MTPFEQFLRWLVTIQLTDILKALGLVALGIYVVFAVVMVRQVGLMRETIDVEHDWWATLVVWIHLLLAIAVLVVAMVVL